MGGGSIRVKSIVPLSDSELRRIQGILKESNCQNESLRATFQETYQRIDEENGVIYFGVHSHDYTYELEV